MATGLLQYSGLITKTRAMQGRLLKREDYVRISEFETVEELISFLKESKGYQRTYESHDDIVHRSQVEAVIHDSLYADYMRLYQFANGEQRAGLELIFFRYEVNVLKLCLEYVAKGGRNFNLGYLNLFFDAHSSYQTQAVVQASSMEEMIAAVAGTPYEAVFRRIESIEGMTIGERAVLLDIYYFTKVWSKIDSLRDPKMKKIFQRVIGTEIDWLNIMWMYRAKRFYQMKPTEILKIMIPVRYRLKKEESKQLMEADTIEIFLELLGKTAYFSGKDAIVNLGDEITYRKIMDRTYRDVCKKYPASIAPVMRYLYEKENEIDILTTSLEGIRYRIPPKEIQDLILR